MKQHIRPIWLIVILAIQGSFVKGQTAQEVAQKLQDINIPAYRIKDTKLTTVIQHLISGAARFDQTGLDPKGIKITSGFDPAVEDPLVTVAFENGTLEKLLQAVTQPIGYTFSVNGSSVIITKKPPEPEIKPEALPPAEDFPCPFSGNSQSGE